MRENTDLEYTPLTDERRKEIEAWQAKLPTTLDKTIPADEVRFNLFNNLLSFEITKREHSEDELIHFINEMKLNLAELLLSNGLLNSNIAAKKTFLIEFWLIYPLDNNLLQDIEVFDDEVFWNQLVEDLENSKNPNKLPPTVFAFALRHLRTNEKPELEQIRSFFKEKYKNYKNQKITQFKEIISCKTSTDEEKVLKFREILHNEIGAKKILAPFLYKNDYRHLILKIYNPCIIVSELKIIIDGYRSTSSLWASPGPELEALRNLLHGRNSRDKIYFEEIERAIKSVQVKTFFDKFTQFGSKKYRVDLINWKQESLFNPTGVDKVILEIRNTLIACNDALTSLRNRNSESQKELRP